MVTRSVSGAVGFGEIKVSLGLIRVSTTSTRFCFEGAREYPSAASPSRRATSIFVVREPQDYLHIETMKKYVFTQP